MGTLVLDALVGAGRPSSPDEGAGGNFTIEREVHTEAGNRIDILIESDAQAALVENKIYANVQNPFDDYAAYLDGRAPRGVRSASCSSRSSPLTRAGRGGSRTSPTP